MWLSEHLLYRFAKALYKTEIAHSSEMKSALTSADDCTAYRRSEIDRILNACALYDVDLSNAVLLDFGCNDGSLSKSYLEIGAKRVIGLDIDAEAIGRARTLNTNPAISFLESGLDEIPLEDQSVDRVVSYDVFEHVSRLDTILAELYRVLRPGGVMLVGTWSWCHPFAPHLWSTLPVPWAHFMVSERTLLRTCRRVYQSDWYVPTMHDFDERGERILERYAEESISTEYLNKFWIRDFERLFSSSDFEFESHLVPFGSKVANWSRAFLEVPYLREFIAGYVWFVLKKS